MAPTVTPVMGAEVAPGDRLQTQYGFSAEITHFDTPPPESFACAMWGDGVRIPYHGRQVLMLPIAPEDIVEIKARAA